MFHYKPSIFHYKPSKNWGFPIFGNLHMSSCQTYLHHVAEVEVPLLAPDGATLGAVDHWIMISKGMPTMTWRGDAVGPFWSWILMNYKGAAQLHNFRNIIKFINFSHLKSDFETLKPHISQSGFAGLKWLCLMGYQPVPSLATKRWR